MLAPQELDRVVGQNIRRVALVLPPRPVDVERRVDIGALAAEGDPTVEPGPWVVARAPHVPLADERGLVPGRLEPHGEGRQIGRHRGAIVEHLVRMGVETGQDRCAARRAQRRCDEGVLEREYPPRPAGRDAGSRSSRCAARVPSNRWSSVKMKTMFRGESRSCAATDLAATMRPRTTQAHTSPATALRVPAVGAMISWSAPAPTALGSS